MKMRYAQKLCSSIREMPRGAYIFLKGVLALACLMLTASALLTALGGQRTAHLALALLETPAGVLLLGVVGLAFLLDRLE